jgi:hypothetical protein
MPVAEAFPKCPFQSRVGALLVVERAKLNCSVVESWKKNIIN